jgi:hypothetical protein
MDIMIAAEEQHHANGRPADEGDTAADASAWGLG